MHDESPSLALSFAIVAAIHVALAAVLFGWLALVTL